MKPYYEDSAVTIYHGDCRDILPQLPKVDLVLTDPPYELGFMGKEWDKQGVSFRAETWKLVLDACKPGAMMLCFGGTRTWHRIAVAIEDAGWEIRDTLMWLYGQGFPKSLDISKAIDKVKGEYVKGEVLPSSRTTGASTTGIATTFREKTAANPQSPEAQLWSGYGTALKPAFEPIILAMKPLDGTFANNALKHGVAGLNIDGSRIKYNMSRETRANYANTIQKAPQYFHGKPMETITPLFKLEQGRFPANLILDEDFIPILCLTDSSKSDRITLEQEILIREFYHDYKMPELSKRVRDLSEQGEGWQGEVLQQGVLSQGVESKDDRREALPLRQTPPSRLNSQDEAGKAIIDKEGEGQSTLQGQLDVKGIQISQYSRTVARDTGDGAADDTEGASGNSGTPIDNGNILESPPDKNRESTPQERNQERQCARESTTNKQLRPHERLHGFAGRKPLLEVLACDVPEQWLKYFEPTGECIRSPYCAAQMLDEQSGEHPSSGVYTKAGRQQKSSGSFIRDWERNYEDKNIFAGQTGGASRFFYCAKASKAERNKGCEELEEKEVYRAGHGNKENDDVTARFRTNMKNDHPTIKPLALMKYLCNLLKPPTGGVLLDPFMGSGTTLRAAKDLGRKAIGIEIEERYCEIAAKRMAQSVMNMEI